MSEGAGECYAASMRRQERKKLSLWVWAMGAGLAMIQASCLEAGFRDLGDSILDPNAALLDRPGRRLVQGSYSGLVVDGSLEDGGRVLAYHHDEGKIRLAIVPFLEGTPCDYTPAVAFERISSKVDLDLDAMVAVQTSGESGGLGSIHFIDFSCQERMPALLDSYLPRVPFPSKSPRGVLMTTGTADLYLIDAMKREQILISSGVSQTAVNGSELWTVEDGALVVRDQDLAVLDSFGENVRGYLFGPGGKDSDHLYFLDDNGLSGWSETGGVRSIVDDACSPFMLTPQVLAYFSPCAERRLMLEAPAQTMGLASKGRVTVRGPDNVLLQTSPIVRFGFEEGPSRILALKSGDPTASSGTLVSLDIPKKPELDDDGFVIASEQELGDDFSMIGTDLFRNYSAGSGDLYVLREDEDHVILDVALVEKNVALLPGASAFSDRGVLADFDRESRVGRLAVIDNGKSSTDIELLTKRVPVQSFPTEAETGEAAFVGEFDLKTNSGKAFLLRKGKPKAVADSALLGTLRFLEQPRALVYLSQSSRPSGTELHAYLIESGIDLLVQDGVTEYRGLPWPAPGILYSVWEGDNAGIWFSKAR